MFESRAYKIEKEIRELRGEIMKIKESLKIPLLHDGEMCTGDLAYAQTSNGTWLPARNVRKVDATVVLQKLLNHLGLRLEEIPKQNETFKINPRPRVTGPK